MSVGRERGGMGDAIPALMLGMGGLLFAMTAPLWASGLMASAALCGLLLPRLGLGGRARRLLSAAAFFALAGAGAALGHWSSAAFLTLMLGAAGWLKLAERSGARDRFAAGLAGLWLIALGLPGLPMDAALGALGITAALLVALLARSAPRHAPGAGSGAARGAILRALAGACVPALALTALLFLFTPRITGDLGVLAFALDLPFVLETEEEAARAPPPTQDAGLEEFQARPDDMRVLVADFSKAAPPFDAFAPPTPELYWRGPVYWTYQDAAWSVRPGYERRAPRLAEKLTGETLEAQIRDVTGAAMYDVTVFPHRGPFLYALDIPAFTPPSGYITRDWQLMNLNPVREMLTYRAMSYVQFRAGSAPDPQTMALALQLPEGEEPRVQAMGRALAAEHGGDAVAIARAARDWFETGYAFDRAAPPIAGANPIDRFVFDARRGYGMHFATAYALMMRAAGIPARVVSGYHGGLHMFLIEKVYVLEKDSHAWVEIYLEEHGWVRMDVARASLAEAERAADGLTRDAPGRMLPPDSRISIWRSTS